MRIAAQLCFLTLCVAVAARADTVVFKNGDRLTGTMLSAVPDHITLASEVAGTLTISMDKIESLSVDKPAVVVSSGRKAIRGQIRLVSTGEWQVVESGNTHVVSSGSVEAILTAEAYRQQFEDDAKLWKGWKGAANFGYSIQSGDQSTRTLSTVVTAIREEPSALVFRPHWRTVSDLTALLSRAKQHETSVRSNTISANLREDYLLSRRDFVFATGGADHIDAQGLYLRQRLGGGYGRDLINSGRMSLKSLVGLNYIHDKFKVGPSKGSLEGSIGENFSSQLNRRVRFDHVLYVYPSFSDAGRYRGETRANVAIKISNRFTVNTGVVDFYLSNPPAGSHKNNMAVTTGMGVTF